MSRGRAARILLAAFLLLVFLYICLCALTWGLRRHRERPLSGTLTFSEALSHPGQFQSGRFRVHWNPDNGGALTVTHADVPGRTIWETPCGTSFLIAGTGHETIKEHRGLFTVSDRRGPHYTEQYLDAIIFDGSKIVFTGTLKQPETAAFVPYQLTLESCSDNQLQFSFTSPSPSINRLYLSCASKKEERIYGFGEQFTYCDLKGKRVPIFVSEQGIGRGKQPLTFLVDLVAGAGGNWHTSYAPVPHYLTSTMRSIYLETHAYSVFDLRDDNVIQISLHDREMRGRFLAGNTPGHLISEYTAVAGRQRPLPDWILEGAVIGMQGGTDKVRRVWEQLKLHDTPIAAFWLQDWVGQRKTIVGRQLWWNWELDPNHYPGWDTLLQDLSTDNIRVMTYINPFFIDPEGHKPYGRNLFQEASAAGHLVRNAKGQTYLIKNTDFSAAMLDMTSPVAWDWMKGILRDQVLSTGASGWMADFGEALPCDARLSSGEPATQVHNHYPELWARLNREVVDEMDNGQDIVFFTRSGFRETPAYSTLCWLGDQMTSWDQHDGIKSAVTGLLSSGFSGFSFNHSDIGGYTSLSTPLYSITRDRELLLRWMELNAFTVVFRTHEGINPEANHQFYTDEETLAHFSHCAKIYAAWADYRKFLVREAAQTGLPVVRHPFIHYPDDPVLQSITCEQFMIGSVFMFAPVLDPGIQTITCHLPEGNWTHLWTGQSWVCPGEGLEVNVSAPLGMPALFYLTASPESHTFIAALEMMGISLT